MISPMSKGLFDRAISQSGTLMNIWWVLSKLIMITSISRLESLNDEHHRFSSRTDVPRPGLAKMRAIRLTDKMKCPIINTNFKAMVECLRKVDAKRITQAVWEFYEWDIDPVVVFPPVVENAFQQEEEAFISSYTFSKHSLDIPWLVGLQSEEGLLKTSGEWLVESDANAAKHAIKMKIGQRTLATNRWWTTWSITGTLCCQSRSITTTFATTTRSASVENSTSSILTTNPFRQRLERILQTWERKTLKICKRFIEEVCSFGAMRITSEFSRTWNTVWETTFEIKHIFICFHTKALLALANSTGEGGRASTELVMLTRCFTSFLRIKPTPLCLAQCRRRKTKSWQD